MKTRREFLQVGLASTAASTSLSMADEPQFGEWRSLFDGHTLDGWKAVPRIGVGRVLREPDAQTLTKETIYDAAIEWHRENGTPQPIFEHTGDWQVIDGAIVGGQNPAGSRRGAYLMSEDTFGDIELEYEIHPDWWTDTGIMIRQHHLGSLGF